MAAELAALRKEVRLSQVELAKLSGVSPRTVGLIEADATTPRADTLRRLADGLATSGAGKLDRAAAAEYFGRLAQAAGFAPIDVATLTDDQVEAYLEELAGGPDVGINLLNLAKSWRDIDPGSKRLVLTVIIETLNRAGGSRRRR
ncbi:MAG: helix-turn-helix transcriptional regulator [Chloroflexota bacterium]